jgi:hypothetical protein
MIYKRSKHVGVFMVCMGKKYVISPYRYVFVLLSEMCTDMNMTKTRVISSWFVATSFTEKAELSIAGVRPNIFHEVRPNKYQTT